MKREPLTSLIRSVWDCFFGAYPDEPIRERWMNAVDVVHYWWDPMDWDHKYDSYGSWHRGNI